MEICPKCFRTMTWYTTYNCGNLYCGYHCDNCGYDTIDNTRTVTTSKTISINNQPKPIIQKVVQVSDESIEKIADAVVRKLADRKTEPTHGKMLICPYCGLEVHSDFDHCPRCGADMRGEKNE